MRLLARLFCVVFTVVVINMLIEGEYKYTNTGNVYYVSANSNPVKFYFSVVWQSLIACVSFYVGFVVKLKAVTKKEDN
jgi:general stress protein CsbA